MSSESFNATRLPCRLASPRGFTLAEVVVAVLIFGLAAAVMGQAVSDSLRAYAATRRGAHNEIPEHHVRRHILAILSRSQVEEGGDMEIPIPVRGEDSGEVQTEMVKIRWEAEVMPTRLLNVYVLEVTIRQESGNNLEESTRTYTAYRPTWGETSEVETLITAKEEAFRDRLSARGVMEEEDEAP